MEDGFRDPASIAKKIHVPTYDEILEKIRSRYPRGGKTLYEKQLATLQKTYDIAISKTDFVRSLARLLDSLHPFYWRLIEIDFDKDKVHKAISCVSKARKLASKFYDKYRFLLLAAEDKRELLRVASEGRGRILSVFKKCRRELGYLRDLVIFIQKLPGIDPGLPTIIVAGAPSSGKSTLVRNVSRAQPRVAAYPFTTTTIHIGHAKVGGRVIQVIDTPGLLDRPVEEMNDVERRAVAALRELDGLVLFLFDVSSDAYMDVERQFKLLLNIIKLIKNKNVIVGFNKIDKAEPSEYERAKALVSRLVESGAVRGTLTLSAISREQAARVIREIAEEFLQA
ncbi:MAG: 50S ribosome-binding GTPase [Desulfurococcales archaeon]|nr:50S ribosome-binding GTPase [Desulfurococcales archaeon]